MQKVIGLDVDRAVLANPSLDKAKTIGSDGRFPLDSHSIDMILCDSVFEHVTDPGIFASEIHRVLKSGGWLCARTPNRYGYIGLATNVIPNRWHASLLRRLQPSRKEIDIFPTRYKLNTRAALRRYFPPNAWVHFVYSWNPEPAYFGASRVAWFITKLSYRFCPEALGAIWNVFLTKK